MYIKNKRIANLYRVFLLIGCSYGLYLNSGIPNGKFAPQMFVFFTILSNAACFVFYVVYLIVKVKQSDNQQFLNKLERLKGAILLIVIVTMLIYHFLLLPQSFSMDNSYNFLSLPDVLVHYFTPLMVLGDWLLFTKKGQWKKYDPLLWLLLPFSYFIFAMIRAEVGGFLTSVNSRYPYFFLDVDIVGIHGLMKNVAIISIAFLVLAYILYAVDKGLNKLKNK